jgi:GxxExxY protein
MEGKLKRQDLVYPELSYKIKGCAYEVFNELGFGHAEKFYQRALAVQFRKEGITFKEQVYTPLKFKGEIIGKQFFDFLVEDKIIVELKKNNNFSKGNIDQVKQYLQTSKLQLALLINFSSNGVVSKRIVNVHDGA